VIETPALCYARGSQPGVPLVVHLPI